MNRKPVLLTASYSFIMIIFLLISGKALALKRSDIKKNLGQVCLDCHPELKKELKGRGLHKSLKADECVSCHTPHAARYENLLTKTGADLCYGCHESSMSILKDKTVHLPVEYGECLKCHTPHVSSNGNLLRQKGEALCFQCHKGSEFKKDYAHKPVKDGRCGSCHYAHSSSNPFLLKQTSPRLCFSCHGANEGLASKHQGYQVKNVDCLLCHNPHSTTRKDLIHSVLHDPYKNKKCESCHPGSPAYIQAAAGNAKSCYKCHNETKERFDGKKMSHIVKGNDECTFCHNPHGSERKDLVKRGDRPLCTACHQDIRKRLRMAKKGLRRHPEVTEGRCSTCHNAHASDEPNFLHSGSLVLCTKCHARHKVACHPVGEKAMDPRYKTPINCITCHNPMEAEFPQIMRLDGTKELCNQCHKY